MPTVKSTRKSSSKKKVNTEEVPEGYECWRCGGHGGYLGGQGYWNTCPEPRCKSGAEIAASKYGIPVKERSDGNV